MKTSLKYRLFLVSLFTLFSIGVEVVTFGMLKFGITPTYFLLDLGVILIFDAILLVLPNAIVSSIIGMVLLTIQCVVSYVNITMYDIYGDLFTLQFINLTHEAIQAIGPNMLNIGKGLVLLSLLLIFIFLVVGVLRKYASFNKYSLKRYAKSFVPLSLLFSLMGNVALHYQQKQFNKSNESYYYTQDMVYQFSMLNIKSESFKNFGTWGYYFKEFKNIYLDSHKVNEITLEKIAKTLEKEQNNVNEFTGLLKNKNIITIMLESTQSYGFDPYLTPNLWKLSQEGLNFTNNVSRNKTNVSEFIGLLGTYPVTEQLDGKEKYYLPFSVANILNEEGYITHYLHENTKEYYSRDKIMPQVGFDGSYFYEDYYDNEPEWGIWDADSQFVSKAINELIPSENEKFYTFWTTLTTHGPYEENYHTEAIFEELGYFDKIDNYDSWVNIMDGTGFEENYRYWQASVMDLDAAIGIIVDTLEEKGILDDTVLVLYGDHQVYYDQIYMIENGTPLNDYSHSSLYETPLIIYNEQLSAEYKSIKNVESTQIKQFSSTYNIVPTILDLLGAEHYSALYPGTSLFYDGEDYNQKNVFVSLQGGIFNNDIFTSNGYDLENTTLEDSSKALEDLRKAANHFFSRIDYLEKVYNNDVFKYLDYKTLKTK